ncbi:MAG: Sapep family Mn(2+)-dependent dipeptidase [Longicatena sp.]
MKNIKLEIENMKEELLKDLETLVSIPSVLDIKSKEKGAPFGKEIRNVFDAFEKIAKRKGFIVKDDDGYAIDAQIGVGEDYIGVLAHLDVVEAFEKAKWNSKPFSLKEENGILYGRGVNDDKGPLLAALYAMELIQKQNLKLKYPIRLIAGGAEETTWECMEHYFKGHKQPICGFSPDGNFPIVNGEKGILQFAFHFPLDETKMQIRCGERLNFVCDALELLTPTQSIAFHGKRALSRNPQRGENAIFAFVKQCKGNAKYESPFYFMMEMLNNEFLDDFYGKKSGLFAEDKEMGTTSVCPMSITWNQSKREVCIDIRYVKSISEEEIINKLNEIAKRYHANLEIIKRKKLLFVNEDSTLVTALKKAYTKVTYEESETFTKGGASYARVLDNGIAFGATFPDEDPFPHMPNEHMSINSLLKACEIYYEALCLLAVDEKNK